MPEVPFSVQCTFPEDRLIPLKNSVNGYLYTSRDLKIPGFEYYLRIYPNVNRGKSVVCLCLNLGNVKKVKADYNVTIKSSNYSQEVQYTFEKTGGWGPSIASTSDFFIPEKKFIVGGNCTVKVNGIFKWENEDTNSGISNLEEQKWKGGELGDELWKKNSRKDFTICIDGKELNIHKNVFDARSDVFEAMFEAGMKESTEHKMVIQDFTFKVVETAVKMIYDCNFVTSLSIDDLMSLLQFFDKYNIPVLQEKVEILLIDKISATTVCRLTNCSIFSNSTKLKDKCIEFLEESFASKTSLSDIEILDREIAVEILQNLVSQTLTLQ